MLQELALFLAGLSVGAVLAHSITRHGRKEDGMTDDMEPTLVDEHMQKSREARAKGDHAKADELSGMATAIHRAESGIDADPYGVEAPSDADTDDDAAEPDSEGLPGTSNERIIRTNDRDHHR